MAKIMQCEDRRGTVHPASYWRAYFAAFDKNTKSARIVFNGYSSKAAAQANEEPIGAKEYVISPAVFDRYFSATVLNPEGVNPYLNAYAYAMATKDVEVSPEVPAVMDAFGAIVTEAEPAVYASFFVHATDDI